MNLADVDAFFEREAGPVWHELRGGLWHSTGSHRFRGILEAGEIHPDPVLPSSEFVWATAGTTYARSVGAVSLFDFAEADWSWLLDENIPKVMPPTAWTAFLRAPEVSVPEDSWISTVWITVDRSKLANFVHWKDAGADWQAGNTARKWMPRLEACHKGPIPLSACSYVIVVCAVQPKEFRRIPLHHFERESLDQIEDDWRKRFAASYAFRALSKDEQTRVWLASISGPAFGPKNPTPGLEEKIRDAQRRLEESRQQGAKPSDSGSANK